MPAGILYSSVEFGDAKPSTCTALAVLVASAAS